MGCYTTSEMRHRRPHAIKAAGPNHLEETEESTLRERADDGSDDMGGSEGAKHEEDDNADRRVSAQPTTSHGAERDCGIPRRRGAERAYQPTRAPRVSRPFTGCHTSFASEKEQRRSVGKEWKRIEWTSSKG